MIRMLTDLLDDRISAEEKIKKLKTEYGLRVTKTIEGEVKDMCTYGDGIERDALKKGRKEGRREGRAEGRKEGRAEGLDALVKSLTKFTKNFDELYAAVVANEAYKTVTREKVRELL